MEPKKSVALVALVLFFVLSPVAMEQTIVREELDSIEYGVGEVVLVKDAIDDADGLLVSNSISRKLVAPDGDGNSEDWFGYSVSLSGDIALVGAYGDDDGTKRDAGAAYLLKKSASGEWEHVQKLVAPDDDGDANDFFGSSVFLSGDSALVGAPRDDDGTENDTGAAYVFDFKPSLPYQVHYR